MRLLDLLEIIFIDDLWLSGFHQLLYANIFFYLILCPQLCNQLMKFLKISFALLNILSTVITIFTMIVYSLC